MVAREVIGKLIGLKQVHQREGVGLRGHLEFASHLQEPVQELLSLLVAILVASCPRLRNSLIRYNQCTESLGLERKVEHLLDELGKNMTGEVSLNYLRPIVGEKEGVKDPNEVDEPLLVRAFLNVNQILNPAASLLENTVYQE